MSAPLPFQVRVLSAVRDVPERTWDALVPPEGAPFLEWAWLDALESSGCAAPEKGWHPRHLTLWRGNTLVAAAPAYQKDHSHGEFVFDWSWATAGERMGVRYYPKLVLGVPFTPATGPRLLVAPGEDRQARGRELLRAVLEGARGSELSSVHALFPAASELQWLEEAGFAVRLGVQYHWRNRGYRTYEDFLARFHSRRRNQIRKERRAAAEQGLALRTLSGDALESVDPEDAFRLYKATVVRHVWGQQSLNLPFFQKVLRTFRRRVEVVEVRRGEQLVAGTFNLASERALYGRWWGAFEEIPFLHFHACLYHPVEECILQGRERFEPGAGGDHKLVRGFEPTLTYSAHWIAHAGLDRAVRQFLATERAAIQQGMPQWRKETGFKDTGFKDA
ncbi:MAG TPA: GNAT family N-acetyltransferase [Myxococcales bacterium]|nr:GNAT family N-acetyltransferase [Myxococcales bacterium]